MKKIWPKLSLVLPALIVILSPSTVLAADTCGDTKVGTPGLGDLCNNATGSNGLEKLINGFANWITGILGLIVVLLIIVSGIQMITSAGNAEAVKAARGRLTNAVIGLVTLIAMQLILRLLGILH